MHTKPLAESDGQFSPPEKDLIFCPRCKKHSVQVREWDSSCGGYTDYKHECTNADCQHHWWVDGGDA